MVDSNIRSLDSSVEIANEFERLCTIEFERDWTEAKERLGRAPTIDELARTPAQRRADALLAMARRSASTVRAGEPAARLLNLRMDYPTFVAEMAHLTGQADVPYPATRVSETTDGTVAAPSTVLDPAVAIQVRRTVFGGPKQVLEYGRSQRLFAGALRDAIIERDEECTDPFCETPARFCQVDHTVEWEDDGHTSIENGGLRCGPDNRKKHAAKRAEQQPPGKRRRPAA